MYNTFDGVVLDFEEGKRIAQVLGSGEPCILHNHGLLTVEQSINEAPFWFVSLHKSCQAQLMAETAAAGSGNKKIYIGEEGAISNCDQIGGPEKARLAFQGYYDEQLAKSNRNFLKQGGIWVLNTLNTLN